MTFPSENRIYAAVFKFGTFHCPIGVPFATPASPAVGAVGLFGVILTAIFTV